MPSLQKSRNVSHKSILSDHNDTEIVIDFKKDIWRNSNTGILNKMLLVSLWIKEEIK